MHRTVLLAVALLVCACVGQGMPQAGCPVVPPDAAGLKAWHDQLDAIDEGYSPDFAYLEGVKLLRRRVVTFQAFFPDLVLSNWWNPVLRGLILVPSKRADSTIATQVTECTGLTLIRTESNYWNTGYTAYYFDRGPYDYVELAWLADWALQAYPEDILYGQNWSVHDEGSGGDI